MKHKHIAVRELYDGQVVEIALGPPPANIITMDLTEELSSELERWCGAASENVKLIVLSGQGAHFSYGASVEEHRPANVGRMLPRFHSLIGQVLDCDIPTLAKVSGLCLGGGFELALACCFIVSADEAKFGTPEIKLGVFPPAATALLPCKVGDARACEVVVTGKSYPAAELHTLGIINHVTGTDKLDDEVSTFIETHFLPRSASSLRIACRASRAPIRRYYHEHIGELEQLYLDTLMSTKDAVEGIEAFLEKRSPKWVNG